MIFSIVRTGFMNLRRDRGALTLSFIVPIAFFSIFAGIFGSRKVGTDPIRVAVVDEDRSAVSRRRPRRSTTPPRPKPPCARATSPWP